MERLRATIVGLLLGQFVGANAETLARLVLMVKHGQARPSSGDVFEVSLNVTFVVAFVGASVGLISARKGWIEYEKVLFGLIAAVVATLLAAIKNSLPPVVDGAAYAFKLVHVLYFIVWAVVVVALPAVIAPNRSHDFEARAQIGSHIIGVVTASAVTGAVCCQLLSWLLARPAASNFINAVFISLGAQSDWNGALWMMGAGSIGGILPAALLATFLPLWYPALWRTSRPISRLSWVFGFAVFTVLWTGIYGALLYSDRDWLKQALEQAIVTRAQLFFAFASFAVSMYLSFFASYLMCARETKYALVAWPVSRRFWVVFPLLNGISFGFAAYVLFGAILQSHEPYVHFRIGVTVALGVTGWLAAGLLVTSMIMMRHVGMRHRVDAS